MMPADQLIIALKIMAVLLGILVLALAFGPQECRCGRCAFHVDERKEKEARQRATAHDAAHKGFGFKPGEPDRFNCGDDSCPRNPRKGDG